MAPLDPYGPSLSSNGAEKRATNTLFGQQRVNHRKFTAYCCEGYAGASPQQIFGPLGLGVSSSKKQSQLNNNVAGVDV